jgi:hypothetical protein
MLVLWYFAFCVAFGVLSLHASQSRRPLLFLIEFIFAALTYFEVPSLGVTSHIGISEFFLIIHQMHMFNALFIEKYPPPSTPFVWERALKMLWNCRWVGTKREAPDIKARATSKTTRYEFLRDRLLAVLFLTLFNRVQNFLFHSLFINDPFISEDSGFLVRIFQRIVLQAAYIELDHPALFQAVFRVCLAFKLISSAWSQLTRLHDVVAILFVSTGIDQPTEWPTLYGDPREAYTMARFWGKFWHKIMYRSVTAYASFISLRILGFSRTSFFGGLVVKFLVFLISGAIHAAIRGRYICGWQDEIAFYLLNFFAILLETVVQTAAKVVRGKGRVKAGTVERTIGHVWTFGFLVWALPFFETRKELCYFG